MDLGGWQAVANPLHIPISGPLATIITRAYHLYALPANRLRVATDWFNDSHRTSPVRPARPDPQRVLRSGSSRAHRHLLPDRRAAPRPPAARINQVNTEGTAGRQLRRHKRPPPLRQRHLGKHPAADKPRDLTVVSGNTNLLSTRGAGLFTSPRAPGVSQGLALHRAARPIAHASFLAWASNRANVACRGTNWREAGGLATCTVQWRMRARSGPHDNHR